jgi:8-oxo-dGTP diphosphatase
VSQAFSERDDRPFVEVVAGIILAPDQSFLMASRPPGKVYAGYWEFPGGKIEPAESPRAALDRELHEELGITPTRADPWLVRTYSYEHARVRIRFFRITRWEGTPTPREGQALAWHPSGPSVLEPMLPANGPILRALTLPDRYAITGADLVGEPHALLGVRQAVQQGVKLFQVREKSFSPARLRQFAAQVVDIAHAGGAKVLINSDPHTAQACGADGVHLDSKRLMLLNERPDIALCAASCHTRQELEHAQKLNLDFAVWGPINATPSHPGQIGRGWEAFAQSLIGFDALPVYAIGGLTTHDLTEAREHGAQGIAGIRGLSLPT